MGLVYLQFSKANVNTDGTVTLQNGDQTICLTSDDVKDIVEELKSETDVSFGETNK